MFDAVKPFSAYAGSRKPRLLVVGEAFGESEAQMLQPFVGSSGKLLFELLGQASEEQREQHQVVVQKFPYDLAWVRHRGDWLEQVGIGLTNVFNLRPVDNKVETLGVEKKMAEPSIAAALGPFSRGKYLPQALRPQLSRLSQEIAEARPNVIVAAGATATWATLGLSGISALRGALSRGHSAGVSPGVKVLPVFHPAYVMRMWEARPILLADLMKAFREADSPTFEYPQRTILHTPEISDVEEWTTDTLRLWPPALVCDIETAKRAITMVGFARSRTDALVVPFRLKEGTENFWPTVDNELRAWAAVEQLLGSGIPLVFQNGMYDLQYLIRMGLHISNPRYDTMLHHHSLFPEMKKDLGFLGSLYANERAWKPMGRHKVAEGDGEKRDE
jgi:uracil-DNA glycosylase